MNSGNTTAHIPNDLVDHVRQLVTQPHCEAAMTEYENWSDSLPAETSTLNHRLYFLELLENTTGDKKLRQNEQLITVLLKDSGIREVGDSFERVGHDGTRKTWTVIWREIGARYGIEMGLRSEDGELLSGELFD